MLQIIWGLLLIQWKNSNWLYMSAVSRCWMHWTWYGYIPSVCIVCQTVRVEVSTSELNSRANSKSEMSYCICTYGPNLQCLLSLLMLFIIYWLYVHIFLKLVICFAICVLKIFALGLRFEMPIAMTIHNVVHHHLLTLCTFHS